jgi:hypothetical protein
MLRSHAARVAMASEASEAAANDARRAVVLVNEAAAARANTDGESESSTITRRLERRLDDALLEVERVLATRAAELHDNTQRTLAAERDTSRERLNVTRDAARAENDRTFNELRRTLDSLSSRVDSNVTLTVRFCGNTGSRWAQLCFTFNGCCVLSLLQGRLETHCDTTNERIMERIEERLAKLDAKLESAAAATSTAVAATHSEAMLAKETTRTISNDIRLAAKEREDELLRRRERDVAATAAAEATEKRHAELVERVASLQASRLKMSDSHPRRTSPSAVPAIPHFALLCHHSL